MIFALNRYLSKPLSLLTAVFFIFGSHAYWPAAANAEGQSRDGGRVIFPYVSLKNPERINGVLSTRKLKTRLPANLPMGLAVGSIYLELASDNASESKVRKVTKDLGLRANQGDELYQLSYESKINADILLADAGHEDLALLEKELSEYNLQGFILQNGQLDPTVLSLTAIAVLSCRFPPQKVEIVSKAMGIAPAAFRSQVGVAQRFLEALHIMRIPKVLSFVETENFVPVGGQGVLPEKKTARREEKKPEPLPQPAPAGEKKESIQPSKEMPPPKAVAEKESVREPDKGAMEKRALEILNGELQAILQDFDNEWKGMNRDNANIIRIFLETEKAKYENWQKRREPLKDSRSLAASKPRTMMNLLMKKMESRLGEVQVVMERLTRAKAGEDNLRQEADRKLQGIKGKINGWKGGDRKTLERLLEEIKADVMGFEGNADKLSGGKKEFNGVLDAVKKMETELQEMKAAEEKESREKDVLEKQKQEALEKERQEVLEREKQEAERKRVEAEKAAEEGRHKQDLQAIQDRRAMLEQELKRLQENLHAVDEDMKRAEEENNRRKAEAFEISRVTGEIEKELGRLSLAWKRADKNNLEAVTRLVSDMGNVSNRFKTAQSGLSQSDGMMVAEARGKFDASLNDLEKKFEEMNTVKDKILKAREEEEKRRVEAEERLKKIKEKIGGWKGGDSRALEVTVGELKAGLIYLEGNVRRLAGGKKELKKVREDLKKLEQTLSGMKAREAKEAEEWGRSEELVKRLNGETAGLTERVNGGGSVEEKEKLLGELATEKGNIAGEAERVANSTGSARIEGNRRAVGEMAVKLEELRKELMAEVGKERLRLGEENSAERLLVSLKGETDEWKGKTETAKGGAANGMRGVLSGMAAARKSWEAALLGLKNESGSERVEALKAEVVSAIKFFETVENSLHQACAAKEQYEAEQERQREEERKRREEEEARQRVEAEGKLREIKEKINGWKGGDSLTLEVTIGELK